MASKVEELKAQVSAIEADLQVAERQAVEAPTSELGAVGALIAGLRARLSGLRDALAAAMAWQERKAEVEAAKAAAAAREEAIAGIRARQADLEGRTRAFFDGIIEVEDRLIDLWAEWDRIKREEKELSEEASALGVSAPLGVATPERVREIARGRSVFLRWKPNCRHGMR